MILILDSVGILLLLAVSLLAVYQWTFALASMLATKDHTSTSPSDWLRFLILIPAHNEAATLPQTLESIANIDYPKNLLQVIVVADRCQDDTATVVRSYGADCLERSSGPSGKGAVISWAIPQVLPYSRPFDGMVILDADTRVDSRLLEAFNDGLISGHQVQQAYNYIANPWETPFTRIIAVTSLLRNALFYSGKTWLGLSGMLMGTGMCFSRQVLERHGWTAFSVGEDWEFSVCLLLKGEHIYFNANAKVHPVESRGFAQASSQRLRWASGRHAVAFRSAWALLSQGIRHRRLSLVDAMVTLVAPNYSTQATVTICCLVAAWYLSADPVWHILLVWSLILTGSFTAYFLLGVAHTSAPLRTLTGIALIPIFLPWRLVIEVLGLIGFGRSRWIRTSRLPTPGDEAIH